MVLLTAQNGLAGLDYESCLPVCCSIEEFHLDWMRDKFGGSFVQQVEATAETDPENALAA